MTARKSDPTLMVPPGTLSEDSLALIGEIVRQAVVEVHSQRPRERLGWRQVTGWLVAPVLGAATFFVAQQVDLKGMKDVLSSHEDRIVHLEQASVSKEVMVEHWRAVDLQLEALRRTDERIEAEMERKR